MGRYLRHDSRRPSDQGNATRSGVTTSCNIHTHSNVREYCKGENIHRAMSDISVLTWNCMLLPFIHEVKQRAYNIASWLRCCASSVDVLVLQEIFSPSAYIVLHRELVHHWPYVVRPLATSLQTSTMNGGVVIASKWPITHVCAMPFTRSVHSDRMVAKGACAATVHLPSCAPVIVVGLHMQAGSDPPAATVRASQWRELAWFVHQRLHHQAAGLASIIVAGDFNEDLRSSTSASRAGLCNVQPPSSHGCTFDLQHNQLAALRAEPGDATALLDGIMVAQPRQSRLAHIAGTMVVRPRTLSGQPMSDHEVLLGVVKGTKVKEELQA